MSNLTPRDILHAPFTPQAVMFRLDQAEAFNGKARCVVYIDASLASDRIEMVDPGWSSEYRLLGTPEHHMPVECKLTVNGVTRANAGQYAHGKADDKHMKSAYSDAFKRAAVEFGVGKYLRSMPQFQVTEAGCWKKKNGKLGGITDQGLAQLRRQYAAAIQDVHLVARFGQPIDHGDTVIDTNRQIQTDAMAEADEADLLSDDHKKILKEIMGKAGVEPKSLDDKLAEDYPVLVRSAVEYAVKQNAIDAGSAEDVQEAALSVNVDEVVAALGVEVAA